ncbi:hypothetical protein CDL15_Pgr017420 [Punica granatum]|uniref:Uncharacterized protein n=1 Tax=Punica granatum TaxID=22663 RepID=A0A218Y4P5_PUNGR|nr:hypothetical protein CDL15_Pgr017420 [Punica granatum]PKI66125.1 hypothetical protein CRG98_013483 [Punica granatum]
MPPQSMQQAPGTKQLPAQTKKLTQMKFVSPKSASQHAATRRVGHLGNLWVRVSHSRSVRSKMRESLAGRGFVFATIGFEDSQTSTSNTTAINAIDHPFEEPKEALLSSEGSHDQKLIWDRMASWEASGIENDGSPEMVSVSNIGDFQSDNTLSTDDVPFSDHFFVKDELLQGNGLSWVLESDIGVGERD